ncbi:Plastocyanin [Candidatus Nitrotoga arctica]|uniref:Plastocyanin n=2 Tax=Candidatus Nitrotoga arctica TaxID=453162 RepID=A0ABM8Z2M9_9PROT|nr:Plastocyanin [Candidatus Nitrotoga arctica]
MARIMKLSHTLLTWAYLGVAATSMTVSAASNNANGVRHATKTPITVTIDAFQFQPDKIRIKRGQSVIFINKDEVPHTVTPDKNAHFVPSGIIKGGEQHEVLFESVGIQDYSCDFHPSMRGRVIVK